MDPTTTPDDYCSKRKTRSCRWLIVVALFKAAVIGCWLAGEYIYFTGQCPCPAAIIISNENSPMTPNHEEVRQKRGCCLFDSDNKQSTLTPTTTGGGRPLKKITIRRKVQHARGGPFQSPHPFRLNRTQKGVRDLGAQQPFVPLEDGTASSPPLRRLQKLRDGVFWNPQTGTLLVKRKVTRKKLIIKERNVAMEEAVAVEATTIAITTLPSSTIAPFSTRPPPTIIPRQVYTSTQLSQFLCAALCMARRLLVAWCVGQLVSGMCFLLGLKLHFQCFLAPQLMLDALFLLLTFIGGLALAALSLIVLVLKTEEFPLGRIGTLLLASAAIHLACGVYFCIFVRTLSRIEAVFGGSGRSGSGGAGDGSGCNDRSSFFDCRRYCGGGGAQGRYVEPVYV